jgi:hypothetical protein
MDEKKIILYTCNKYYLDLSRDEVLLCNGYTFCDEETRARRRCKQLILTLESEQK